MKVCVIGLGYVGLPLATLIAEKHETFGYDIDREVVVKVNKGISPINDKDLAKKMKKLKGRIKATIDPRILSKVDVIIICVPTPVDDNNNPDLKLLISASEDVSKNLQKGQLIIIESTIYPGVSEEVVLPILERSGLKGGKDFYLVHCPERVDIGNKDWPLEKVPRVIGGLSDEGVKKATAFYKTFLKADVMPLSSIKSAEATKIVENSFRDVNIAFVNELAKSFDTLGIDLIEVLKAASSKPYGFLPHYPGAGVGGHCIPVDPYYLIRRAAKSGFKHEFLRLAREINESMPEYTVKRLEEGLNELGKPVKGTKIGILGLAYKGGVDDTRNSPAFRIIEILKRKGGKVVAYDPYVNEGSLDDVLKSDAVILVTSHPEFRKIDFSRSNVKLVVDGRNFLEKERIRKMGIRYKGIGSG